MRNALIGLLFVCVFSLCLSGASAQDLNIEARKVENLSIKKTVEAVPMVPADQLFFGLKVEEGKRMPLSDNILPSERICPKGEERLVSDKPEDYYFTFIPTDDGSKSLAVLYGRLADGVSLSEMKTASTYDFVKNNKLWNAQIGKEKLFIWFFPKDFSGDRWTYALMQTFLNKLQCSSLGKKAGDEKGEMFRCVYSLVLNGKPEELIAKAKESDGYLWISGTNVFCPAPMQPLKDMVERFADADKDAVPDECDNCPGMPNFSLEDTDADGVGDACQALAECEEKLKGAAPAVEVQSDEAATGPSGTEADAAKGVEGAAGSSIEFMGGCSLLRQ